MTSITSQSGGSETGNPLTDNASSDRNHGCSMEKASDDKFEEKDLDQFDYLRFTSGDFHGIAGSVSVPRRHCFKNLQEGFEMFAGL
jgi:hypothetical protein